jgi:hypothetical protein
MRPSLIIAAEPAQELPSRDEREPGATKRAAGTKKPRDPVLVAAGDVACDPGAPTFYDGVGTANSCRQRDTAELVERLDPDAVLVLGDDQYDDGRYAKYLRSYDPSWGRFKRISHPTPGDGFVTGGYYRYWGHSARPSGTPWYSFRVGAWHLISLNSNCDLVDGCGPGSPQAQWLRRDLAAHRTACQLAFWHEPRFSSTKPAGARNMKPIWKVLSDFDAELVLSGEAHNYERFRGLDAGGRPRPGGVRQFIVGTGGKSLVPFTRRSNGSAQRNSTTFGVLELTLQEKGYAWRFVPLPGGTFEDSGSAACR